MYDSGSLCLPVGDVYSNAPTTVFWLGAFKILLSTGSCTFMYLHACLCIYKDTGMHVHSSSLFIYFKLVHMQINQQLSPF